MTMVEKVDSGVAPCCPGLLDGVPAIQNPSEALEWIRDP